MNALGFELAPTIEPHRNAVPSAVATLPGRVGAPWWGRAIGSAAWAMAHARVRQWQHRAMHPEASQRATLAALCRESARTEFGRDHGLDGVRTYEDFVARVPLCTYADIEPQLQRMRRGEANVLWPGRIPWFARSSGTSGTASVRKVLPISREQVRWQRRMALDVIAQYLVQSCDRTLTSGFGLALTPSTSFTTEDAVTICTNPALMLALTPDPARRFGLPRGDISDLADVDTKLTAIAEAYVDHDVRLVAGTTCWFPVLFERVIAAARARGRAATTVADVWPNLSALIGGGMSPAPYRPWIDRLAGRRTLLVNHYNATEGGAFACADTPDDDRMLVLPDRGVFLEFVPRDELARDRPRRVPLWRVERGETYAIVVTTAAGLSAYVLGDLVRFTSVFPHRLEVVGRLSGGLSLTQEQTSDAELEAAVLEAAEKTSTRVRGFCAAGEMCEGSSARGRYRFFVEIDSPDLQADAFVRAIDDALQRLNYIYALNRAGDVGLRAPRVECLAPDAIASVCREAGLTSPQQKLPRVVSASLAEALTKRARAVASRSSEREGVS